MIRLLKNIRNAKIPENKFSKYLVYAIGEIVLIVIGILLALQINNWNEKQKAGQEEIVILNNLLESLSAAKSQSSTEIDMENQLKESLLRILGKSADGNTNNLSFISDSLFLFVLWNSNPDVPVINSYSDLKNTGKIGLIKNRKIRESFTNLELSLEKLNTMVKDRLTVQQIRIDEILINDVNFVRLLHSIEPEFDVANEIQNNYTSILHNEKIRNLFALKLSLTYSAIKTRKELADEFDHLIQLLETELNAKQQLGS